MTYITKKIKNHFKELNINFNILTEHPLKLHHENARNFFHKLHSKMYFIKEESKQFFDKEKINF